MAGQPVDPVAVFLAGDLFPMMTGLWPASSGQLDVNSRGAAQAWSHMLRGMSVSQIRNAVLAMAEDADRQFAPRPAEVRAMCQRMAGVQALPANASPQVSQRAVEMRAESRLFCLHGRVDADLLREEMDCIVAELTAVGVVITGEVL